VTLRRIVEAAAGLVVGVVLVTAASGLPSVARTIAEAVPASAIIGMGYALLRGSGHARV
jgi:hypothetical protein